MNKKMNEIELPIFGKIKLEESDGEYEYWLWKHDFEGKPVDLDIHFDELTEKNIDIVTKALNDLNEIHQVGVVGFQKDFEAGGSVQEYIEEWNEDGFIQVFEEGEFEEFIKNTNPEETIENRLLSLIRIVRIGIYIRSDKPFIVLDFAFGYEQNQGFRDDMIVVTLNEKYEVTEITSEG